MSTTDEMFAEAAILRRKAMEYSDLADRYNNAAEALAPLEEAQRLHRQTGRSAIGPNGPQRAKGDRAAPGDRARQIVAVIKKNPGLTLTSIATKIGADRGHLSGTVLPQLIEAGTIQRDDDLRYYPAQNGSS